MKRICFIIAAVALALIFTQCKKGNDINPNTEGVKITLSVDDGSKADVNPETGEVTFKNGDKIYVGSGGNYVGTLTRSSGIFTGNITDPVEGEPLYFYFLGGPVSIDGNCITCNITNQIQGQHVISCGTSTRNYSSSVSSYSSKLMNKCALVKFNVTTRSSYFTCLRGFNNLVTIDFSSNTLTASQINEGIIKLSGGSGERWATLLPQEAVASGTAYSGDNKYSGEYGPVPSINENDYLNEGITVSIYEGDVVDLGLPSGTVWATRNIGAIVPEDYGDYFAWGETQTKTSYTESNYQHCVGNLENLTKYCCNPDVGYNGYTDNLTVLLPSDDAATYQLGDDWRMPTKEEWQELINYTTHTWITKNGVNGWLFEASNGESLFLPAAGNRSDNYLNSVGSYAAYWSSTQTTDAPWSMYNGNAYVLSGYTTELHMSYAGYRASGQSVRAIYDKDD